jgi:translation initiation factor IF-2
VKLAKAPKDKEPEDELPEVPEAELEVEVEEDVDAERPKKVPREPAVEKEKEPKRARGRVRRPSRLKRDGAPEEDASAASRKRVFKVKGGPKGRPAAEVERHVRIAGPMTLREVSEKSGIKVSSIIRFLMDELDILATINHVTDVDEVALVCDKFGIEYDIAISEEPERELEVITQASQEANLEPRPPVVTVMGHVDHGKTKLLDALRRTHVVDQEAGGITQHIGAYQTSINGRLITFLDTPGHEAFTAMRARGSQATDLVVLVVAAEDGVMPQTIEAIEHCRSAKAPIIVAINKIDKPDANPERVKQQLSQHGLVSEEWGGDTVFVKVSALTGEGLESLLEMVNLQAELMELKADPTAPPFGIVIENEIDPGVGIVATVLVVQGTFKKGQYILCGDSVGRIKRMVDEHGKEIDTAGPSTPARVMGFTDQPENGERVYGFDAKRKAQQIADSRNNQRARDSVTKPTGLISLDDVFSRFKDEQVKDLTVVVKADVQGSQEAVVESLGKLSVEDLKVNVIRGGVGQINESDVMLASASGAMIVGFNVTLAGQARKLAEREKVQIRLYRIIYKLIEDMELALRGLLAPDIVDVPIGEVEIRAIFRTDRNSVICGGMVISGKAQRNAYFQLKRGGEVVLEGQLGSLKRFKDDAREVAEGFECGLRIDGTSDVQEGDILALYVKEEREHIPVSAGSSTESQGA